jgi:L-fuculokinase
VKQDLVAVIDIGKTHAKLLVIESRSGDLVWSRELLNTAVVADGLQQMDVAALEEWLLAALSAVPFKKAITQIVPVTHGASAVLLDDKGRVLAAPDYEDVRFEPSTPQYAAERDPFERTYSPLLPLGLNLGRQLYYLQQRMPGLYSRGANILLYPQYWAWRLCGVMASEVSSLGCHTDLWQPSKAQYSDLARRAGWAEHLPPLRPASDVLGSVTSAVQDRTGLSGSCQVICGIHDSNASYLCHLAGRSMQEPFALIASGTWVVVLAQDVDLGRLRADSDMLANVDAFGNAVATARFMGGREYEAIARTAGLKCHPDSDALAAVIAQQAMALPSFASGGPFPGKPGQLREGGGLSDVQRTALATLYVALMCDLRLDDLGSHSDVIVDGPLASNVLFGGILAALRPQHRLLLADRRAGIARGALYLACQQASLPIAGVQPVPITNSGLQEYRARWRNRLNDSAE